MEGREGHVLRAAQPRWGPLLSDPDRRPGARLAEGREAEVFEWGPGTVLRLMRDPGAGDRMAQGVAAMTMARASGVAAPAVHEIVEIDGRPGVVMERIDARDLLAELSARPWTVVRLGRTLGRIHAQLHEAEAPAELAPLRDRIRDALAQAQALALPPDLARFALARLDELPDGDRICHGDLQPANVLLGADGPKLIDWTNAARGDPMADVARTRLMLRLGAVPPGTKRILRALDRSGRGIVVRAYLRGYRAVRPLDPALVDRWEVVRAADRLREGIEAEHPALLRLLRDAAR